MCSSQHTNLQFRKFLKLQLGVISISDIEWVKRKDPLLDYEENSADEMTELFSLQKWSISNLWEHFLVSEHSRPIWLRSDGLTDDVWAHILHTCTRTEPILQTFKKHNEYTALDTRTQTNMRHV